MKTITIGGNKFVEWTESDLRFTGWENECIIIDRTENHYLIPVERYEELQSKKVNGKKNGTVMK